MKHLLMILALALPALPATADHPGERIDEVMADREPAFEPTDLRRIPPLRGTTTGGAPLRLDALQDRIVVVSFTPEGCGAPCAMQQVLLRKAQEGLNITPMRDRVMFLSVGQAAGDAGDGVNWREMTVEGGADRASASFAALSARDGGAPKVHVINRGGRHAAVFHGADFAHVNLILYINELTNAPPPEPGLLDRILGLLQ